MRIIPIKSLSNDLQSYINSRYGGSKNFFLSLLLIRSILLLLSKVLFYITEKNESIPINDAVVEAEQTIEKFEIETSRKKKVKEFLKKILPIRGGQLGVAGIARFIADNKEILAWVIQLLRGLSGRDLEINPYHLYMGTAVLRGDSKEICNDPKSVFGYIFALYGSHKNSGSETALHEQEADFLRELFEGDKLKSKSINQKHIATFLACTVLLLKSLLDIPDGAGRPTIRVFFQSLIKAIRQGKISKNVAKMLVRRLRQSGIPMPREVEEAVQEAIAN